MKKLSDVFSIFLMICVLILTLASPAYAQPTALNFTVNTSEDTSDASIGNGVCADSSGFCSLRAAIQESKYQFNINSVQATIYFGFSQPTTIYLQNSLPNQSAADIIGPNDLSVTLDGMNSSEIGIDLHPTSSTTIKNLRLQGFTFAAINITSYEGSDTIEKNIIINNKQRGIRVAGFTTGHSTAGTVSIIGNYIGYNPLSEVEAANGGNGIEIIGLDGSSSGSTIRIGGTSAEHRNVISGNNGCGVLIDSPDFENQTIIEGNYIGIADDGSTVISNSTGICVYSHVGLLTIGGSSEAAGNLISGNQTNGIRISNAVNFKVQHNLMSTNQTGSAFLPNGNFDLSVNKCSLANIQDNTALQGFSLSATEAEPLTEVSILRNYLGITRGGFSRPASTSQRGIHLEHVYQNSQIAYNRIVGYGTGIHVDTGTYVNILSNRIYNIHKLGIDIEPLNVTNLNDYQDLDSGPNFRQNFPTLSIRRIDQTTYEVFDITVHLHSTPNTTFRVELFSSDICFGGGYGEGKELEKFSNIVVTDANGDADWQVDPIYSFEIAGDCFTATASKNLGGGLFGSTSEFARVVPAIYLPVIVR